MTNQKFLLTAFIIPLLTMGAGCTPLSTTTPVSQPVTVQTTSTPDSSLTPTDSLASVSHTPSSDGERTIVAAEPDETWVLYTNKALGYSVNTPTKGGNTPTWEMKYVDQSDPHIINGCYYYLNPTPKNPPQGDIVVVSDGTKFCHTKIELGDSPSIFIVDEYATIVGKKIIVIEFKKGITDASVFVASDYQKTLDGIMGTFQMNY